MGKFLQIILNYAYQFERNIALTGNRTPVSRVAGENSTTEPPTRCKFPK